jgi:hypothetical protein
MIKITASLLLLTGSALAQAGVFYEMTQHDLSDPQAKPAIERIYLQDGKFRTETGTSKISINIFKDQAMYLLDPAARSYRIIDSKAMDQMAGRVAAARQQMQARLEQMPAAQREKMQQMLAGMQQKMATQPQSLVYRTTTRTGNAGGYSCRIWEELEGEIKKAEICVVPAGLLPGGNEMTQVMKSVGEFMVRMRKALGSGGDVAAASGWAAIEKLGGIPIITRQFNQAGKATSETALTAARAMPLKSELFEVPADYTSQTIGAIK